MQGVLSIVVALSISLAPLAAEDDPRAIAPEAADPGLVAQQADVEIGAPAVDEPASPPTPATKEPTPPPAQKPSGSCFRQRGQCRQLSILGIVFGSIGLASIGTGIGLMQKPNEPIADDPAFEISYEPPGVVAIGMGVGVLVTGVLMIIAGQRAYKLGLDGSSARRRAGGGRWIRN